MWKRNVHKVKAGIQTQAGYIVDLTSICQLEPRRSIFDTPHLCPGKATTGFSSWKGTSFLGL